MGVLTSVSVHGGPCKAKLRSTNLYWGVFPKNCKPRTMPSEQKLECYDDSKYGAKLY